MNSRVSVNRELVESTLLLQMEYTDNLCPAITKPRITRKDFIEALVRERKTVLERELRKL